MMRLISIINKSIKEQIRHFWIFILTIFMAPFFVCIYYLINEASKPQYDLLILNQDKGIAHSSQEINYGNFLIETIKTVVTDTFDIPLTIKTAADRSGAMNRLKNRKADALVVIPEDFSERVHNLANSNDEKSINIEFIGDLTNINYMISAIWANGIVNEYIFEATQKISPIKVTETGLGISGKVDEFDLYMPGLLILSVIMLMFSASIAIVTEVENKTMIRLKLSKITAFEFLSGVSFVQILVGVISVVLTLMVALWLGFDFVGSLSIATFIVVLTCISIIAFSLIVAAFTKTANEVLIVGNFPLLLFMFFTGAAFPMEGKALFSIAGYPIAIQGLMSPTHSVSALKKVLIMGMGMKDILPEIIVLIVLTMIYFAIGVWAFQRRHMKVA
ncbi:MAG: ABC transporter permease [bacterium]|nr:MAG: ABC transporter permease [bacterium]